MASPTGPQGPPGPDYPPGYGPPPNQAPPLPPTGPPQQLSGPAKYVQRSRSPEEERVRSALPREKGFLGALLDINFDHMVTPKVIKVFSLLALMMISVQCITFVALGLWIYSWQNWWAWGLILLIASPFVWLFEALLVRIFMESIIVRFKTVEYLRVIKDKL